jgi:hypothetical protein
MIMRIFTFLAMVLLSACDSNKVDLYDACKSMGNMCEKLSVDSRCSSLRSDVIVQAYKIQKGLVFNDKYNQLLSLEKYVECTEKSTWIEYKDRENNPVFQQRNGKQLTKEKIANLKEYQKRNKKEKEKRNISFQTSRKLFNDLNNSVINENTVHLLYWNWTRNHNENALKKLIKLDEEGKINDSLIIFSLAEESIRYDHNKGIAQMIKSLSKYPQDYYVEQKSRGGFDKLEKGPDRKLHTQILQSLSSAYFRKKEYEKSFIFAKVLILNGNDTADQDMILRNFEKKNLRLVSALNNKAELIHKKLKKGEFNIDCKELPRKCKKS